MKKIQVLLSAYNGQKYIEKQLDSIFSQEGVDVHCLVRDDGSTDGTLDILNKYKKKYKNLEIISGRNLGYKKSFMELVYMSGQYDYYAFADQDDVWEPKKLIRAISLMSVRSYNLPLMYCSNCTLVDSNLNKIGMLHNKKNIIPSSKVRALVQGFAHGCTMVFNSVARDLLLKYKPKGEYAHDFWIPTILLFLGEVIYDHQSYILYRQHNDNVFGEKTPLNKIIKINIKRFANKGFYSGLVNELLTGYKEYLRKDDQLLLQEIVVYKAFFVKKAKLLFNKELRKKSFRGTLFLKLLVLFSRF